MAKLNILTGKQPGALKTVLYGPEGIGKSTLAARFPRPLFLDTEGSTRHMDVARTEPPRSWTQLLEQISCVWEDPGLCGTLVLDTADWAEQLCIAEFCARKKLAGIEEIGYGKGYVYIAEDFGRLLNCLSEIVDKGVHVVLTAHAQMRKFEQPDEMGAYDRWDLKLQKKTAALVKEWADLLLFANYKTFAVASDGKGKKFKAQGGKRVLYTAHHPCWDAKNRLGLPGELPLEFDALAPWLPGAGPSVPDKPPVPENVPAPENSPASSPPEAGLYVPAVLRPLLASAQVTEREVREVIARRQGSFPLGTAWETMEKTGFVAGWVLPHWEKITAMIRENPDRLPFTCQEHT